MEKNGCFRKAAGDACQSAHGGIMEATQAVKILRQVLNGTHPADEQARLSASFLAERLAGLKSKSPLFKGVGFSLDVQRLAGNPTAIAV